MKYPKSIEKYFTMLFYCYFKADTITFSYKLSQKEKLIKTEVNQ